DDDKDDEKDDEEEGGDDEQEYDEEVKDDETRDEESFDPIPKTPKNSDDEGNGDEDLGLNVGGEEGYVEEEEEDELYRDININQGGQSSSVSSQFVTSMLNPTLDVGMESIFETTSQMDVQTPTSVAPLPITAPTTTPSTITTITTTSQAPILPTISNRLRDEAQRENDEFLKSVNENMQKIIKEQVKEQVKVQVSKILPRIEQTVNEQLEAKVLTRSSYSSKTSYVVATDLTEMELKKIIIEKMEGNKETVTLKRQRDDDVDKDEEPSAGPDRGSKRRGEGKEPESASAPMETATKSTGRPSVRWKSPHIQSLTQKPPSLDRDWNKTVPAIHGSIQPLISELAKLFDSRSSFNELMDTPLDFSNFLINRLKSSGAQYHLEEVFKATTDQLDWVNPEGQQYPHNLLKPLPLIQNNRGRHVIPFEHFINNDFEYLRGGASSRKYTTSITKTKVADYWHIKIIVIQRRVEDLQLGVKSYQKKHNLTKPYSYQSDLKRKEAYTAYSNPRGFINQNKDKKNRLMRIDELHKFSDGMHTDVRTALDDRLKWIRMQYLPQSIWRKSDKE
nr:hypothetical protein [Tanacetum cinerariifolium]